MELITARPLEIFSGTGGVGKTTLATARALCLAQTKRVLLITIDPSRRLKQILQLSMENSGNLTPIQLDNFHAEFTGALDAILMNPMTTFRRMQDRNSNKPLNTILRQLLGPYGSLNEVMSIIEVNRHLANGKYDTIILDTPPGKNFIDFLQTSQRIQAFFRPSFVKVFTQLKEQTNKKSPTFLKQLLQTGIDKLLSYLQKVTGDEFIENFVTAVSDIYELTPEFQTALSFQQRLKNADDINWFLVTSCEQGKSKEALELFRQSTPFLPSHNYLLVNKTIDLVDNHKKNVSTPCAQLQQALINRQEDLITQLKESFSTVHTFTEVLSSDPQQHVLQLLKQWS